MTVRTSTLGNGLTIVTDEMAHLESVSVGMWVNAGARHETPAQHGISHMLEHMAFKGTESRTAREIVEQVEAVGGHLNAHTTHEATAYYARLLKDDLPLAVDILADILQHSVFDHAELERERGVIIQEIGQAADTPDDLVFDHLLSASYPDQALGRPILGTPDTVGGFGRDALKGYMDERYSASAMTLAAAGAVDHDRLVGLASEAFEQVVEAPYRNPDPATFAGQDRREDKDLEQVHLTLAFDGVPYGDPDYYTAQVFSSIFGGGMSSRLFQELREKRGLCYSTYSFSWSFEDTGLFGLYVGTGPDDVAELTPVIAGELARMGADVTEEEASRARAQLKAGLLMGLESSASRVEQIARQQMIYDRVLPIDEIVEQVEQVDPAALKRFAGRLMQKSPAIGAVGPISGLETHDRIAARFA